MQKITPKKTYTFYDLVNMLQVTGWSMLTECYSSCNTKFIVFEPSIALSSYHDLRLVVSSREPLELLKAMQKLCITYDRKYWDYQGAALPVNYTIQKVLQDLISEYKYLKQHEVKNEN